MQKYLVGSKVLIARVVGGTSYGLAPAATMKALLPAVSFMQGVSEIGDHGLKAYSSSLNVQELNLRRLRVFYTNRYIQYSISGPFGIADVFCPIPKIDFM